MAGQINQKRQCHRHPKNIGKTGKIFSENARKLKFQTKLKLRKKVIDILSSSDILTLVITAGT